MEQRADVDHLNATLKDQLSKKGIIFETANRESFRKALSDAGFYKEWRDKFGAAPWAALEATVGKMS